MMLLSVTIDLITFSLLGLFFRFNVILSRLASSPIGIFSETLVTRSSEALVTSPLEEFVKFSSEAMVKLSLER